MSKNTTYPSLSAEVESSSTFGVILSYTGVLYVAFSRVRHSSDIMIMSTPARIRRKVEHERPTSYVRPSCPTHVLECMFPDDVAVYQMLALKGPAADRQGAGPIH